MALCPAVTEPTSFTVIQDLRQQPRKTALEALAAMASLEKKCFPSNEALDLSPALLTKQNTRVLYALSDSDNTLPIVAYAVCVRWRKSLLLHKICVAERLRGQGIGKALMTDILLRAAREGCRFVELWVDEARSAARALYTGFGFRQVDFVNNYYGDGRNGVKMQREIR